MCVPGVDLDEAFWAAGFVLIEASGCGFRH